MSRSELDPIKAEKQGQTGIEICFSHARNIWVYQEVPARESFFCITLRLYGCWP